MYGQLGLGDALSRGDGADEMDANLPSVDLGANWTVVEVTAGADHTCARLENGAERALKCWGRNYYGTLGLGDTDDRGDVGGEMGDSLPAVQLETGRSAVALALGYQSCALLDDETVQCWGRNSHGELGLGDTDNRGDVGVPQEMGDSLPSVPLCPAPCPAGYTGADGGPCAACEAGTFKAAAGSGSCVACPSQTSSAEGSNQLTDCKCLPGYTAASDGVACSVCEAGTSKSAVGTGACETCPANSESSSGSALCQCSAGFTGADGGPCSACLAGTYKATAGAGNCATCEAGTYAATTGERSCSPCLVGTYKAAAGSGSCVACPSHSSCAAGSDELTDCACVSGYTAASDGGACSACEAGTYKTSAGSRSCEACPSHSTSAAGSDELEDCACGAGYLGPDGGACVVCFDCDSVTFTATLAMSRAEFTADKQGAYVAGVAQAVSVAPSRVAIASITDQSARRRLLAASIAVSTKVTVAPAPLSAAPWLSSISQTPP